MTRELFPINLLGGSVARVIETVGDVTPPAEEPVQVPITIGPNFKDFRPNSKTNAVYDPEGGSPKASSATVVAESSPSELTTSPPATEAPPVVVEKELKDPDPSDSDDETPTTTGSETLPVTVSTPESPEILTSSFLQS